MQCVKQLLLLLSCVPFVAVCLRGGNAVFHAPVRHSSWARAFETCLYGTNSSTGRSYRAEAEQQQRFDRRTHSAPASVVSAAVFEAAHNETADRGRATSFTTELSRSFGEEMREAGEDLKQLLRLRQMS